MQCRDARYTGNGKVPVYNTFQTVRYNHFAQFGISLVAVPKFTTMRQCNPNCRKTGGKRDNGETTMDQTGETHSTHPKSIKKESVRSEIWHYFAYKRDEKGEPTDLNAPVCKCCYKSCAAMGGNTSNINKHLSLAHPDLFKEFKGRQVSVSFN